MHVVAANYNKEKLIGGLEMLIKRYSLTLWMNMV